MDTGLWMYRVGIEMTPLGTPSLLRAILAASVDPGKPVSNWKGIPAFSAASTSSRKILGGL